ncbi:transferase [Spirochaetia bacterium]|nr:transferase [Spirochaetia bacterium]
MKTVIVGAGGFGREVLFLLTEINSTKESFDILGFVDSNPLLQGKIINEYPVLGNDSWLLNYSNAINVVVCVGNSQLRKKIVKNLSKNKNIYFPNIIANDVRCSPTVNMGKGCIIFFSSVLLVDISIGDFVVVHCDCTIGHNVCINDFATVYHSVNVLGDVSIGSCVEIGSGSQIIPQKTVGDNAIIGAGSVVVKNIPADCTVVGVPAKPLPPPI